MRHRRSVRERHLDRHTDLIVGVEVELVAVGLDLSVPDRPVWETDSARVTEEDLWVPAWVSGPRFDGAP